MFHIVQIFHRIEFTFRVFKFVIESIYFHKSCCRVLGKFVVRILAVRVTWMS